MGRIVGYLFVIYGMIVWVATVSPVFVLSYVLAKGKRADKLRSDLFWLPCPWFRALGRRVGGWLDRRFLEIRRSLSHRWPRGVWVIYGAAALLLVLISFIV